MKGTRQATGSCKVMSFRTSYNWRHAISRGVGAIGVVGVNVHVSVSRAGVVLPEVQKRGAAEAGGELPTAPGPGAAVIR